MQSFSSAKRTCSASASAVEWTATERSPISRQARMTRSAISPRFAMRTFLNMGTRGELAAPPAKSLVERSPPSLTRSRLHLLRLGHADEVLAVLDVLAVPHQDLFHLAVRFGLDLVHQLHRLDDADHLPLAHGLAELDEGGGLGRGRAVEGTDEGRADEGPGPLGRLGLH